jgi:hypothetical protein
VVRVRVPRVMVGLLGFLWRVDVVEQTKNVGRRRAGVAGVYLTICDGNSNTSRSHFHLEIYFHSNGINLQLFKTVEANGTQLVTEF